MAGDRWVGEAGCLEPFHLCPSLAVVWHGPAITRATDADDGSLTRIEWVQLQTGAATCLKPGGLSLINIGSHPVPDAEAEYIAYLGGRYADYFTAEWVKDRWPITPGHLWRANHLAAGWQI